MRAMICCAVALVVSLHAYGAAPAEALSQARSMIVSGDCRHAAAVLQEAIPAATALTPDKTRTDALGALHFYSALAFSNCNQSAKAKEQVREFLRVHPGQSALAATKYPRQFIALFDEVQRASSGDAQTAFSHHYPDFNSYTNSQIAAEPLVRWGASSEFQLLADDGERSQWPSLRDDDARARFVDTFWARRELIKGEFSRRISYADAQWGDTLERGSLSDRGRVFVLLGIPARVYTKPLTRGDGAFIPSRSPIAIDGVLERWVYFKDQLPTNVQTSAVEFRFISQPGYGDHVMQKEFWPIKTLAEARKNTQTKPE